MIKLRLLLIHPKKSSDLATCKNYLDVFCDVKINSLKQYQL